MTDLFEILKTQREKRAITIREVSSKTGIDQAIMSKIERGIRLPTEQQLFRIATYYNLDIDYLKKYWLAEKILKEVNQYPKIAAEALTLAEPKRLWPHPWPLVIPSSLGAL